MATRAEVLAAYANNPKAALNPSQDDIDFWRQNGLGNFNEIVDQIRANNPTLAAKIDKERAEAALTTPTTPVVTTPTTPVVTTPTTPVVTTPITPVVTPPTPPVVTTPTTPVVTPTTGNMVTRAQVLAAYAANPKSELRPSEEAINFWMSNGLDQFNTLTDQIRAANPTLAAQIDRDRAAAVTTPITPITPVTPVTPTGGTGTTDNSALYRKLVSDAYGTIGRTGFGPGAGQIDQAGYDFWVNALQNGILTPSTFNSSFNNAVGQYVVRNPTDAVTQYVQQYKPFQNTGLLSQQQLQPQSVGAPAVPTYQPQSLAQNFQNYMGIPIGAQYNPAVTAGGASPYSQIRALSPQMVNPYAGTVSNIAMGGYNPMLYENVKAAARAAGSLAPTDYLVGGSDGAATAPPGPAAGSDGSGGSAVAASTVYAKGGLVDSLLGPNPIGPDDGMAGLDRGEYVIKKSSVDKYGKGLLDMINEGKVPVKKAKSLLF